MKKCSLILFLLLSPVFVTAEGLVTRTNQSASWVRLPSRNASSGIDAVYYNPAGLTKIDNGLSLSISNQSVLETIIIDNSYSGVSGTFFPNSKKYEGFSSEIISPSVYAVYKNDRLAISLGYNTIGGSGKINYENGLPSFELNKADIVLLLPPAAGVTEYDSDINFTYSSAVRGLQSGVSYKINDILSVASGFRFLFSVNKIKGDVKNIQVYRNLDGWTRADILTSNIALAATGAYNGAINGRGTSSLIVAGLGSLYFEQVPEYYLSPERKGELKETLALFGYPSTTIIESADTIFRAEADKFSHAASLLGDSRADATQTGTGITPYFSINISPSENLNIGIRYELRTRLILTNTTTHDLQTGYAPDGSAVTMYPNGARTRNDMPSMLSAGVDYKVLKALKISLGMDYFFDKTADYGHLLDDDNDPATPAIAVSNSEIIENNGMSLHAGIEYNLSENFLVSCGYVRANKGVNSNYQSDIKFGLANQTFGLGGAYSVNKKIQINFGTALILYKDDTKVTDHLLAGNNIIIPVKETFSKQTFIVSIGTDFRF